MPWLLVLVLFLGVVGQAHAADGSQTGGATTVKGDVLYWEGEELVVKEISGREVRLHVNGDTKIEGVAGRLKTGDKISAQVTSSGHAQSIMLQLPDGGALPPGPR